MELKLLIAEDDRLLAEAVSDYFTAKGWSTECVYDGITALEKAERHSYQMILLDVMLPGCDGFSVCRKIREVSGTPVFFITARVMEEDELNGYAVGADDYITKPFSTRELMARVKANIRRTAMLKQQQSAGTGEQMIASGDLAINTDRYEVTKQGRPIELTQREYELLCFLASRPDKVYSRTDLMEQVWNYEYVGDVRTVDVTVRRLREKIEDDPANPTYIITRRGVGYFFSTQR